MTLVTGKTRVLGIIGWPVDHSLSPPMQNAALHALHLDFIYVPFAVSPESLPAAVAGLRSLGIAGFNVTIPHKTAIIPLLDELTPEAAIIGAVNTVSRVGDKLVGHNTDCTGFMTSLRRDLGFDPKGVKAVMVVGAGGAARAAVAGLCREGAASVIVVNRSEEPARELVASFSSHFPRTHLYAAPLEALASAPLLGSVDLLVNTTSVGMKGTSFQTLDISLLKTGAKVYDMVYAPALTPLLASAASRGIDGANGLGMLAAQGEESFRIWTGKAPPAGLMMASLGAQVGEPNCE